MNTYQYRTEEDRYSKRVAMTEIAANDYNLNISRYVSTTQSEEAIDLAAVNALLLDIDRRQQAATEQHNAFLKALGLPLLSSPS